MLARASPDDVDLARSILGELLDELSEVPGVRGVMLTFDDFVIGMEQFGTRIMPLMRCLDKAKKAA